MERMTEWRGGHGALLRGDGYTRLAQYEDTGFTPEEFDDLCRFMSKTRMALGFKTLTELRKAVEDGVIIRLPCALHDPVYVIEAEFTGRKKTGEHVERAEIDCFRIGESGVPVADICTDGGGWYEAMEPKDYYTSRDAAEKALAAERDGGAGNGI